MIPPAPHYEPESERLGQDESDSLYRYIMDTADSVRRGPWYLRPAFMLREPAPVHREEGKADA